MSEDSGKITEISDNVSDTCCENSSKQSKRNKYSCWDEIDAVWMQDAFLVQTIYVHEEILEWIVEEIDENILKELIRATVEEVYHHHLSGRVFMITFFLHKFTTSTCYKALNKLKHSMTYKMSWKAKPTYFLRIDTKFEGAKVMLLDFLHNHKINGHINTTTVEVNWMGIPKIEIYEFQENLSDGTIQEIDEIFESIKCPAPIYICDQFEWHRELGDFIEIDTLALDICTEYWNRFNLLKDYSVPDILCLDLVNKDYRVESFNEYLDRYLTTLLKKSQCQLKSKLDPITNYLLRFLASYFILRFHAEIPMMCCSYKDLPILKLYEIPINPKCKDVIYLTGDQPHPDTLLTVKCQKEKYVITNYTHMTHSLFLDLVKMSKKCQTFTFRFDKEFIFNYKIDRTSLNDSRDLTWSSYEGKFITIELKDCIKSNAANLIKFVSYIISAFTAQNWPCYELRLKNCMLDDYKWLSKIGYGCLEIQFNLSICPQLIKILSSGLNRPRKIVFYNCQNITDEQVMMLLENIGTKNLFIGGINSYTPLLFFRVAGYLMVKRNVNSIDAQSLLEILSLWDENVRKKIEKIYFAYEPESGQVVIRNRITNKILDLYCFWNDINEDDINEVSNNIYAE